MHRREFIALVGGMAASWPLATSAQQPAPKKRLAVIGFSKVEDLRIGRNKNATVFFEELARLGFVEGENLIVERYQFRPDGLADLAREVVDSRPDVIVCYGSPMTSRLKAFTSTIPIVTYTGDPVRFGLIASLARPGGNITGVSADPGVEIWGKRLEFLSRSVPKLTNLLFLSTQAGWLGAGGQAVQEAAQRLGISIVRAVVTSPYDAAEYKRVLSSIQRDRLDAGMISDEFEHFNHRFLLVEMLRQMRLPAIYNSRDQVEAGGLMAYVIDIDAAVRMQVALLAQLLRGANPADIPYFQMDRYELVINMRAAKELGLTLPEGLVAGASTVIE